MSTASSMERLDALRPVAESKAADAPANDRVRVAYLMCLHEELLTPARAVIEYCNMMLAEIDAEHHPELFVANLRSIHLAANQLRSLIHDILRPGSVVGAGTDSESRTVESQLRHEMRNKLTPIIGYAEMWIADAATEHFLEGFIEDLQLIAREGHRCLQLVDNIINSSDSKPSDLRLRAIKDLVASTPNRAAAAEPGALLVVDDSPTNCDILRRRLERVGHTVTLAHDGAEAWQLLQQQPFDLVLLDILMPETSGVEVLTRLKADPKLRDLPVIMISALDEGDLVARCIEHGAEDYLPKPVDPVFLQARINAGLEKRRLRQREVCHLAEIELQKQRADELLHVILPGKFVQELKDTNTVVPRQYDNVAVLFADITNFTPFCEQHLPADVIVSLQRLVETWEESADRHGVQKIKTIGDAFMAACGLLEPVENPVLACLHCGLEMIAATQSLPIGWNLRVGIDCGQVVAGVIGRRQYLFDLWGDTVNTAARMESHGEPGRVNLSQDAWNRIAPFCRGTQRDGLKVKGKSSMSMYFFDVFSPGEVAIA